MIHLATYYVHFSKPLFHFSQNEFLPQKVMVRYRYEIIHSISLEPQYNTHGKNISNVDFVLFLSFFFFFNELRFSFTENSQSSVTFLCNNEPVSVCLVKLLLIWYSKVFQLSISNLINLKGSFMTILFTVCRIKISLRLKNIYMSLS